ncbi:DUF4760 domain-containing protein [Pseudactinotalea sp. HY160]|uniref:DUF4760 domain-containing protein n=1 Tax=Pseudactinotalea sp. HY160 TaxID=2654490 RepID=UPI00128CC884|nr:DUF4760 domain-containing protein [Pseudactinotalea sp. HY160]MPV50469.1 DUF4760 domain-containing protein [Pseudactinotalea sp. HY160]
MNTAQSGRRMLLVVPWALTVILALLSAYLLLGPGGISSIFSASERAYALAMILIGAASLTTAISSLVLVRNVSRRDDTGARSELLRATLDAWSRWSDTTRDSRVLLSERLGTDTITHTQADALVHRPLRLHDRHGRELDEQQARDVLYAMISVLNGLERIAIGVNTGAYDRRLLTAVGGTIIKRSFTRFSPYVERRRESAQAHSGQSRAFVELEILVSEIPEAVVDHARLKKLNEGCR